MLANPNYYVLIVTIIIVLLCAYLFSFGLMDIFKYFLVAAASSYITLYFYDSHIENIYFSDYED